MEFVIIPVDRCTVAELNLDENIVLAKVADQFRVFVEQRLAGPVELGEFIDKRFVVSALMLDDAGRRGKFEMRRPFDIVDAGVNFAEFRDVGKQSRTAKEVLFFALHDSRLIKSAGSTFNASAILSTLSMERLRVPRSMSEI